MELSDAGIREQPFRTHGQPLLFVSYQGQADAQKFLLRVHEDPHGFGLLQAPSLAGKSTLLRRFVDTRPADTEIALITGQYSESRAMIERIVRDFGFDVKLNSVGEMLNVVKVFACQQAASHHAPMLIIEDAHQLDPDSLRILCKLADFKVGNASALRIVLSSDRCMLPVVKAPAMECIGRRLTAAFNLCPMEDHETVSYLHAKLRAGGCEDPESVVPSEVGYALHQAAGGWPGIVDRLVLLALGRAQSIPLSCDDIERPLVPAMTGNGGLQPVRTNLSDDDDAKLYLSYNGKTIREIRFDRPRIMIGRSEHNDLPIVSRFISRHHAMFIRDANMTVLMDLNSTNGTFVNAERISNHVLRNDDVVTIGHHHLKFSDQRAVSGGSLEGAGFNDTIIMKSLDDLRRMLARDNTTLLDADAPPQAADKAG